MWRIQIVWLMKSPTPTIKKQIVSSGTLVGGCAVNVFPLGGQSGDLRVA